MNLKLSLSAATLLIFSTALDAAAQPPQTCAERAQIIARLADKYHETPIAAGLMTDGRLLEIFTTVDGSTWTALATSVGGMSCIVAVGTDWFTREPLPTNGQGA